MEKARRKISMGTFVLFVIYAFLSAGGLILFKLGGQATSIGIKQTGFSLQVSWQLIIGVFCYLLSFLLWLIIVSKTQLTFAMPLSVGVVNLLVFLGSSRFLGEQITLIKVTGLVVIIVGLFLITIDR